jgi:hypothetical protein
MIYRNGQRYFNIIQDNAEFRVRQVKRKIQSQGETNNRFHYAENGEFHVWEPGVDFMYQPSLTIGPHFDSARNLVLASAQIRPDANYYPIVGDFSGTDTIVGVNALYTASVDGGWPCAEIEPVLTGTLREWTRFEMGVTTGSVLREDAKMILDTDGTVHYDTSSGILNSGRWIDHIYCSAWFLCYVNKVNWISNDDGLSSVLNGVYMAGGSEVHDYKCSMKRVVKTILGTLDEGFILICTDGQYATLRPDGIVYDKQQDYWRRMGRLDSPRLKVIFKTGGYIRLCQWGYEYGFGEVRPL